MKNSTILIGIGSLILIIIGLIFIGLGAPKKENDTSYSDDELMTKPLPTKNSNLNFTVDDRTEICAEALEEIYRDDIFIYYLPCIQSNTIYLVYDDGIEITLRDALDEKVVTIEELEQANLKISKEPLYEID